MATFHFKEPSKAEINIETYFGIRITQVRGLNPPQPKEIFTRDWAEENGVDYYVSPSPATRKVKSSEVTIEFYAETGATTAIAKYKAFCDYLLAAETPLRYRDTVQYCQVNLLYTANSTSWYQLFDSTTTKLVAQVTFLNPTGAVTAV